jgi:hypothetical protein
MKLTPQEIALIDDTLVLNGLIYEDIKLEVIDHIASEIEEKLTIEQVSFEAAFKEIFENWKDELRPSYSRLVDKRHSKPKLVTHKCHSLAKKQLVIALLISLLTSFLLLGLIRNFNNEMVISSIKTGFRILCLVSGFSIIISRFLIWKSKHITTYGYLFKNNYLVLTPYMFLVGFGLFPLKHFDSNLPSNFVFVFFPILFFVASIFCLFLVFKHFQFDKKLAKI